MLFEEEDNRYDDDSSNPKWNIFQFILAIFCCMSVGCFVKMPIDHYFGSGWSLVMYIIFLLILAPPFIYLQLRLGCQFKLGFLGLFDKFFPFSLGFGIAALIRNVISLIYISVIMTHSLSYIFFSLYNCDSKTLCVGGPFMWSQCDDFEKSGNCEDVRESALMARTAEESFHFNFVWDRARSIDSLPQFSQAWWQIPGLVLIPHFITWAFIFATVIGGAKIFGFILYAVVPSSLIMFFIVFGFIFSQANSIKQKEPVMNRFYYNFAAQIQVLVNSYDTYEFSPIIWGLLSNFVHLTMILNIWNGVYPIMGKWIGNGQKKRHFSWIIVIVVFGSVGQLPTLLISAALASSFDKDYLRCRISQELSMPFTIMTHVFTKFAFHKGIACIYFISLFLFLLMSQSFLLITVLENAIDRLRLYNHQIDRHRQKAYIISCVLIIFFMVLLSVPALLKTGYYWTILIDRYIDRLMCLIMIGQAIGFIISYSRIKSKDPKLLKLFFIILLSIVTVLTFALFLWYVADSWTPPTSDKCEFERVSSEVEPFPMGFRAIGWVTALAPIILGLSIGLLLSGLRASKNSVPFCNYLLQGERSTVQSDPYADVGYTHPMEGLRPLTHAGTESLRPLTHMGTETESSSWGGYFADR